MASVKELATQFQIVQFGDPESLSFRIVFVHVGHVVSPHHTIPLHPSAALTDQSVSFICTSTAGGNVRHELAGDEPYSPLRVAKSSDGHVARHASSAPWNCGVIPQTEHPAAPSSGTPTSASKGLKGWFTSPQPTEGGGVVPPISPRGDTARGPVQAIEFGGGTARRVGEVYAIKILGSIGVVRGGVEAGRVEWRVLGIASDHRMASTLGDVADMSKKMPGILEAVMEWVKGGDKGSASLFPRNFPSVEPTRSSALTASLLQEAHNFWQLQHSSDRGSSHMMTPVMSISPDALAEAWLPFTSRYNQPPPAPVPPILLPSPIGSSSPTPSPSTTLPRVLLHQSSDAKWKISLSDQGGVRNATNKSPTTPRPSPFASSLSTIPIPDSSPSPADSRPAPLPPPTCQPLTSPRPLQSPPRSSPNGYKSREEDGFLKSPPVVRQERQFRRRAGGVNVVDNTSQVHPLSGPLTPVHIFLGGSSISTFPSVSGGKTIDKRAPTLAHATSFRLPSRPLISKSTPKSRPGEKVGPTPVAVTRPLLRSGGSGPIGNFLVPSSKKPVSQCPAMALVEKVGKLQLVGERKARSGVLQSTTVFGGGAVLARESRREVRTHRQGLSMPVIGVWLEETIPVGEEKGQKGEKGQKAEEIQKRDDATSESDSEIAMAMPVKAESGGGRRVGGGDVAGIAEMAQLLKMLVDQGQEMALAKLIGQSWTGANVKETQQGNTWRDLVAAARPEGTATSLPNQQPEPNRSRRSFEAASKVPEGSWKGGGGVRSVFDTGERGERGRGMGMGTEMGMVRPGVGRDGGGGVAGRRGVPEFQTARKGDSRVLQPQQSESGGQFSALDAMLWADEGNREQKEVSVHFPSPRTQKVSGLKGINWREEAVAQAGMRGGLQRVIRKV